MNKIEIIDYIASYYNLNNRSVDKTTGDCLYNGEDGKKCAFALMCIDSSNLPEGKNCFVILRDLGDNILKEEFRGYDSVFYKKIQNLHDNEYYWDKNGLSEPGKKHVKSLKEFYA